MMLSVTRFRVSTFPVVVTELKVPTEVMFGCAAVVTVPAVVEVATVPVTLPPTTFDKPPASPVNTPVFAVIAEAVIVPLTPKPVNVPTDVMFACAAPDTEPATEARATVPETLAPATAFAVAANVTSPVTFAPATALALVASAARVAKATVPETLAPATALAVAANVTSPLTLAPATAFADVALVANATAPDTLPPATAFAVAANVTSPVTFPPAIADKFAPSPATYVNTPTSCYLLTLPDL